MPPIRVIREGQLFLLDNTRLVPGDLIELDRGDIAPCDLRIVFSANLSVLTYTGIVKGEAQYVQTQKNENAVCLMQDLNDICRHGNMLYGGSVIERGYARALVVETGKHTYIGGLHGGYPLKTSQTLPEYTVQTKKVATILQTALLLAVLPLLTLCLLLGKTEESLPMLFSALLCLCLANLAGNMETWMKFGMAMGIHRALSANPRGERALIRTDKNADRLLDVDYLFLLGPQAFSETTARENAGTALPSVGREREDELQRREMRLVLSEHFLGSREAQIQQLRAAGITPILFLEEDSRQSVTYILQTGIAESADEIAMAESFRKKQRPITYGLGKYQAYCGFSNEELRELLIYIHKLRKKVAVFGNLPREYALLKNADVRFAGVDDMSVYTDSNRSREKSARSSRGREDVATQRMRQQADVLIPCADRRHGGIAAIRHTMLTVSDLQTNLITLSRFLLYTQVIRMVLALPVMIAGVYTMPPIQTVYSGLIVDFVLAYMMILRAGGNELHKNEKMMRYSWQTTIVEALFAGVSTLTAFLFIHFNYSDRVSASSALFAALLLIQMTAFLIHWDVLSGLRNRTNWKSFLISGGVLLFMSLIVWIANRDVQIGLKPIGAPYGYLLLIAPLSVILVHVVIRLYQLGRAR